MTAQPPRRIPAAEQARRSSRVAGAVELWLVRHRHRLPAVHAVMFVAFVALLLVPPLLPDPPEQAGPFDHLTVAANLALWGVWFPLLLVSVLVSGRSWCGLLCPMGAASEAASKHGLKLSLPRWLTWEGTPILSFLVVTILGQTTGVRDHAEAAAEVFGGTMALAIVTGFLFAPGKRPWCRHACPIGLLLGVFSRLGAVEFAAKQPEAGGDRHTEKGVCPTMIDVRRKTESRHCIECMRCVAPAAPGGLYVRLRKPGAEIEQIARHNPNLAEVWFLFLGSGVALGGFLWTVLPLFDALRDGLGEWAIDHGMAWIGEPGPWWLMSVHPARREVFAWLDFLTISGFMIGVMAALAALLAAATAAAAWISGRLGASAPFTRRFTQLGYQFAPVALVSLLIGLGGGLFTALHTLGLPKDAVLAVKAALFLAGILWSLHLGNRILAGLGARTRWLALAPGIAGSAVVAAAWAAALFNLRY